MGLDSIQRNGIHPCLRDGLGGVGQEVGEWAAFTRRANLSSGAGIGADGLFRRVSSICPVNGSGWGRRTTVNSVRSRAC